MAMPVPASLFPVALAGPLVASSPTRLRLRPPAKGLTYASTTTWEEFAAGTICQTSTLRQELTLSGQPPPAGGTLTVQASPPLREPPGNPEPPEPLELLAQRLAVLYDQLELAVAPSGQLLAVLNHAQIAQRWQTLRAELAAGQLPADAMTPYLLDFCDRQLADPARLLRSLAFDYRYAALVGDFYDQPLGGPTPAPRPPQVFAQFFAGGGLWFSQALTTEPATGGVVLHVRGTLDAARTDVAAITRQLAARLPAGAELPALRGHYTATHELEAATGLPRRVELTVAARLGEYYNKQYHLLLERL